jgi:hypothetical protein
MYCPAWLTLRQEQKELHPFRNCRIAINPQKRLSADIWNQVKTKFYQSVGTDHHR